MNYALLVIFCNTFILVRSLKVQIFGESRIVRGATAHFGALITSNGKNATGSYTLEWQDNALDTHTVSHDITGAYDTWNVTYNRSNTPPGIYEVQVTILKLHFLPITSARYTFEITDKLNGDLHLIQDNKTRDIFVSNETTVVHQIELHASDAEFLKTATSVTTYWFIDCINYGPTHDFAFKYNYTTIGDYSVDALVVANFDPITTTTETPTTTTTTTTTIAPPNTTITAATSTSTTAKPNTTDAVVESKSLNGTTDVSQSVVPLKPEANITFPYVCGATDERPVIGNTYGYFKAALKVRAPISNITTENLKWIHHGESINITVRCKGSGPYNYCYSVLKGVYNATGNETCVIQYTKDECVLSIKRYFFGSGDWTLLLIINNEINKIVHPVTISVLDIKKQPQLSVIVVPVAFSLVAVVLIVFGIAYFIQNRSRFTVEVADFDFGRQSSDLEYKTFSERLRESVSNMFTRVPTPTPSTSDVPIWPPTKTYGSMT